MPHELEEQGLQPRVNPTVLKYLDRCRESLRLDKHEPNVLDWGCGRGRSVLGLRQLGYSVFGADIDPGEAAFGKGALASPYTSIPLHDRPAPRGGF